ncbi:MAG: diaminopimelate epimerase [Candidatus Melainabacteria bacterium]|nr:diaminopimelate epimerase [Candidatus Melainabacteria bacterium]
MMCHDRQLGQQTKGSLPFVKMQALGNDFVVLKQSELSVLELDVVLHLEWRLLMGKLAQVLCDRHWGVGADGLIVVLDQSSQECDLGWVFTNSDGSPSAMCGNGLRCLALLAVREKLVDKKAFSVYTGAGPVNILFKDQDHITLDLGQPILESTCIPVAGPPRDQVVGESLDIDGLKLKATCVSMGNPHCVLFNSQLDVSQYHHVAPLIQSLPIFPEGVNVEFVQKVSPNYAQVFVWERGCGETLACASGAAAVLVAGVLEMVLERKSQIELPGGVLDVQWTENDNRVRLTGPAREVFRGTADVVSLLREARRLQ